MYRKSQKPEWKAVDREALKQYVDACALIKETEGEIRKLEKKRKTMVQASVKGSNQEFPFQPQHFKVQGTIFTFDDDGRLRYEQEMLVQQKQKAEELKRRVDQWMPTVPLRMQRIIRWKYIEGMSWEEVASRIGGKATAESVRKQLENFMK